MTQVPANAQMRGVYLIHCENGDHYVGWADDVDARVTVHENTVCTPPTPDEISAAHAAGVKPVWAQHGDGAHFLGVMNYKKINWTVTRVWWGESKKFERWIKNWGGKKKLCPHPDCMGKRALARATGGETFKKWLTRRADAQANEAMGRTGEGDEI